MAVEKKNQDQEFEHITVLITIAGGLIYDVKFYKEPMSALTALSDFVQHMDVEHEDAGVYNAHKLIANSKDFLNENDEFIENSWVFKRI